MSLGKIRDVVLSFSPVIGPFWYCGAVRSKSEILGPPKRHNSLVQLTHEPKHVSWPKLHYVYIENIGPFQATAAKAWKRLHALVPEILEHNRITGYMSLYKFKP